MYIISRQICHVHLFVTVWTSTVGQSHNNFLGNIADILEGAGHNVTLLMVEFDSDFKSDTGTKLVKHVIRYSSPYYDPADWQTLTFKQGKVFKVVFGIVDDPTLIRTLRDSKFDLGIYEMFHSCPAGVMELAGVPKTMLASAIGIGYHHYRILGMERQSSFVPASLTSYGGRMNFIGRLSNVLINGLSWIFANICERFEQALFESRFPDFPDLHELIQEFERIVSKGAKGVILFSLGSLVKSSHMPVDIRQAFIEAFRSFPDYVVLWKDDAIVNTTTPNIYFHSWLPQVDLLADGRVKLFITHGGMNSIHEALLFGVPMITLPLFADQDSNAAVAAERGFSITLNKLALSKEIIIDAINRALGRDGEESVYTLRVRQAARLLKGSPEEMRQTIRKLAQISATETALNHLKLDIRHLNSLQYYNIDHVIRTRASGIRMRNNVACSESYYTLAIHML
uniref:UDP-glucuronosyltransferase n=1 Tax=Angiostrongylus cantonensis TaxID=6313 RepID=A0A0K0D2B5_ANGCA